MDNKSFGSIPDFQAISDFWRQHSQHLPGFGNLAMPAMSVEELDKRIADLKAVEAWLKLNTELLRNGIQGLEMQRQAFATFNQFTSNANSPNFFSDPQPEAKAENKEQQRAANSASSAQEDVASNWWNMMQQQFEQITHLAAQSFVSPTKANADVSPQAATATPAADTPEQGDELDDQFVSREKGGAHNPSAKRKSTSKSKPGKID